MELKTSETRFGSLFSYYSACINGYIHYDKCFGKVFSPHRKKHKACRKNYEPYILKYKALVSKYMAYIFDEVKYVNDNKLYRCLEIVLIVMKIRELCAKFELRRIKGGEVRPREPVLNKM